LMMVLETVGANNHSPLMMGIGNRWGE
jgi:hypothetical protein